MRDLGTVERDDAARPVLQFQQVEKRFVVGKRTLQAVRGVDLEVWPGRVTGLIGPDGAGKTTLMRLAVGLLKADQGRILTLGLDVGKEPLAVQASVGYMPQRFGLYEDLSVNENLDLYADLQGVPVEERAGRYQELTKMTGLGHVTGRLAGRLSGGMKQKLGLACTLVHPPRLLLLDEPTVGVDPVSRRELWQIVYHLVREQGMTVLLSTAYLDEAERCEEVLLMNQGTLVSRGPPARLREQVRGRTYLVSAPGQHKRALRARLAANEQVVDALIQAENVRVVMESEGPPDLVALLPGVTRVSVQETPPRLEDSFVAMLSSQQRDRVTGLGPQLVEHRQVAGTGPVIDVLDVKRRFGDFYAVKGVSFQVQRGEIFGLLGANGAGKSTMFRMLCGLLPATEGSLRVAGLDLRHAAAAARARIGYMSQKFSLYGNLSAAENLSFFSSAYGLSGRRQRERITQALENFELGAMADTNSMDLPLGHKQRLAMACALMHEPEVLFLDEPTSGVDPLARREFWAHINALAESHVTVMVTTHFMEEAEYCDRLAIMADGEILALGAPEQIKAQQRTPEHPDPTMEDAFIGLIEHRSAASS